jgi:hypothetical protein
MHKTSRVHWSPRRSWVALSLLISALMAVSTTSMVSGQSSVTVTSFGAVADGILRTDGSMVAGSLVLTSVSSSFGSSDVGKYMQVIGAGPGGTTHTDGTISAGSQVLSSGSGTFASADVGRGIIVLGAGPGGSNLVTAIQQYSSATSVTLTVAAASSVSNTPYYYGAMTLEGTIQSVQSSTSVTLSSPAAATITGAMFAYGTDNHAAFQAALDSVGSAGGGTVTVPQPGSCPSGAVCGYVTTTTDQMTAQSPGAIKIRYNNISIIGDAPQTNVFCRGAWKAYTNSVAFSGQTATIRGNCIAIGDNGGPNGAAGLAVSNVTIANLHLFGMTNGNTYSVNYTPTGPPLTTTGDGWDETHKAIHLWDNSAFSNITINSVVIQDFKGENIYSGGSTLTGIIIENSTLTNFNGDGISMLAADLQVLNNHISNGSNSGVENSTRSVTSAALVRQIYDSNTVSLMQREGINVVGVDSGVAAGVVQITNNYFDTIGQIHGNGARAAVYLDPQAAGNLPPANVTVSGNTCHDCYSFGSINTSGNTQVSGNTFIVDSYNCSSFMSFMNSLDGITIANNTGYMTANATSNALKLSSVYLIDPGYQTGSFVWTNATLQGNIWNFPGTPNYTFVTSSGLGFNIIGHYNLIWQGDSCQGCTYPDRDHGLVSLASGTTIEPYGPVVHVNGNPAPVTATIDASKEQDGAQVQIVNVGSNQVTFASDSNLSLASPVVLSGGIQSAVTFAFSSAVGRFVLGSGGSASSVIANRGTPQSATVGNVFSTPLQATVTDGSGHPVSGVNVTFTAPSSGATAVFGGSNTATSVTDSTGVATAPAMSANGQAGIYIVTATAAGVSTPANFNLTNNPGPPAKITATGRAAQSAVVNQTFTSALQATVTDTNGNTISGVAVTFTAPVSGASATFTGVATAVTNASGVAASSPVTANGVAGTYTVTATVSGVGTAANFSLTNMAAIVGGGALSGSGTSASTAVNLTTEGGSDWIHLGDTSGNPTALNRKSGVPPQISNYSIVGAGTAATYDNDPRPLSWTDGTPTASGTSNTNGIYISAIGNGLSITAPANTSAQTLTVHVGGWQSGGTLTAHLSDNSAADYVDTTSVATASYDRNYTLTYRAATAGQTLTVSWVMTSGAGNVTLNGGALAGSSITATAGTPQSATVNTAFGSALQATVKDASNNPISGVTVTFAVPASGPSASFTGAATAVTNASGVATASRLTANGVTGTYLVTATILGVAPANFSLTNAAQTPASITATLGTPQSTTVNTAFGTALRATVKDASNNPISGLTVTFTVPGNGAGASFTGAASAVTNASGVATSSPVTANGVAGTYTVTATVPGVGTTANFSLTNLAEVVSGGSLSGSGTSANASVNLTVEGGADWVHWGDSVLNRKSGVTPQISTYAIVGAGMVQPFNNDPRPLNWTDGSPTASSTNNTNGVYINFTGNGFSITAPAGTAAQTLTVHVGGWYSGGTLTAHLSDNSAANFVDTTASVSASYDRNYTLTYSAASAGQSLTVTWVMSSGTGNVTLDGAALAGGGASMTATAGTPQSTAVNTAFGTALQVTVLSAGKTPVSGATVTFTAPTSGASASFAAGSTAVTNANGIATAPTLTANGTAGTYAVTASISGVATPATFSLTNTPAAGGAGSLSGSGTSATTAVNLTAEGVSDWVHWGDSVLNRKSGVSAQISTYAIVGSGVARDYNNDLRPLSWTDGSPTASGTNNTNGIYISAIGNGFSITAPADTTLRTITVHVGGWESGGTFTAHLSDGSAVDFTDATGVVNGQYDRNYTISYRAASASQSLKVSWTMTSGVSSANVTLNGAALQ